MKVIELTSDNFQTTIANGTVLIDFWAPWCGPCKMIAPILEELVEGLGDSIKICKVNIDDNPELAMQFSVRSIPTLLLFKGGELVSHNVGFESKEKLESWIKSHL